MTEFRGEFRGDSPLSLFAFDTRHFAVHEILMERGACLRPCNRRCRIVQSQNVLLLAKSAVKSESKERCDSTVSQSLTDAAISARTRLCAWTSA